MTRRSAIPMVLVLISGILLGWTAHWLVDGEVRRNGKIEEVAPPSDARIPPSPTAAQVEAKRVSTIDTVVGGKSLSAGPDTESGSSPGLAEKTEAGSDRPAIHRFVGPVEVEAGTRGGNAEDLKDPSLASGITNPVDQSGNVAAQPADDPKAKPGEGIQGPSPEEAVPVSVASPKTFEFSDEELMKIGRRIWQSECAVTVEGMTSWNQGEDFASLGIGHFLWFPEGRDAIFDESFPAVLDFMVVQGKESGIPEWIIRDRRGKEWPSCPWPDRKEFISEFDGKRMVELRSFLEKTVPLQAEFLVARFRAALPKLLEEAGAGAPEVEGRFGALAQSPGGAFAMIDYVNFKGEGTKKEERYAGEGWGLLQVLQNMKADVPEEESPVFEFSRAAGRVLTKRTEDNPVDARWLPGWRNRVADYQKPF